MRNGVQLISYVDRLGGGGLETIRNILDGPLDGVFTGIHLLPFFTPFDGTDTGFDPIDHSAVDSRLGDWAAVARIGATHDITADLIVNHISDRSPQFQDFLARGDASPHAGMFLEMSTVFPDGPSADDLAAIYRPRPGAPFTDVRLADGSPRTMWTTFTPHQIDLDLSADTAVSYLLSVLDRHAEAAVDQVRLDAIGYAIKTAGTSSFMTPETYLFIERLGIEVRQRGMGALVEIHSHYSDQIAVANVVDRVYDFALPPLILHALFTGSASSLVTWLTMSPRNAITVLDTHDGIGVVDVGPANDKPGLLDATQVDELVEGIHEASGGESRLATGAGKSNLDLYQVNCTYYSALGGDDSRYLLSRLIQFLSPGIPQVYYAGLLAASNDLELLASTGNGRDINRPRYSLDDIEHELQRPVVQRLIAMIGWRNSHPAFGGAFAVGGSGSVLTMRWANGDATIEATIDVAAASFVVHSADGDRSVTIGDWDAFAS